MPRRLFLSMNQTSDGTMKTQSDYYSEPFFLNTIYGLRKHPELVSLPQGTEKGSLLKKRPPQEIITSLKTMMGVRSIVFFFVQGNSGKS